MFLLTSCNNSFQRRNPAYASQTSARQNIEAVDRKSVKNAEAKVEQISVFAAGTDHALSKVEEPTREVEVAKQMNDRVISLSGSPTIDELKRVYAMVDDLTSQMQLEKQRGIENLDKKDKEITRLQEESKYILALKDVEIRKYVTVSEKLAGQLDAANQQLDKMNSWFGLGAIGYGTKRLVISLAWFIGGFTIVFFLLRLFAASNPFIGALFSVFEVISSFFISALKGLTPGAFKFANFTPTRIVDQYKKLTEKIIDVFETLKDRDEALSSNGGTVKTYTLKEIFSMFSQRFGDDDKNLVDEIKVRLGWK
jgi:hypothetical protein